MRWLILSDIHGNLEALEAALASAAGQYDRVACLGDVVGYGADPNAVTDWVRAHAAATVRGNHDRASTGDAVLEWFNPAAQASAVWTRHELTPENLAYLQGLPAGPLDLDGFELVHGSPADEDDYLIQIADAEPLAQRLNRPVTFFGHTHVQGGFYYEQGRVRRLARVGSNSRELALEISDRAGYLVNPGSVGQPRDNDWRAAYVLYEPEARLVMYRRVEYDLAAAQDKIRQAGLPGVLADRLAVGM